MIFTRLLAFTLALPLLAGAQPMDRIVFNDQDLFLSGANIAWVNFARDVGPGTTNFNRFEGMFSELNQSGGNAMRFWVHITGVNSPVWNGSEVTGPGSGTINDLRVILDRAWDEGIGLILCLWSFDMLRISNGTGITDRAHDLLTDAALTQTYIDNALTPMVQALAGHPALIAWEIFNEPEGMSVEHGWNFNRHVRMADIQRFINQLTGAIHRADPNALVTNGSWAFIASSDVTPSGKTTRRAADLHPDELHHIRQSLSAKYAHPFTEAETRQFYDALHSRVNFNYYRDDRLIAAGGDPEGTLDFYGVHYYEWAGTALSPFHHDFDTWGLTKPLVIGEFYLGGSGGDGDPDNTYGIPYPELYPTLIETGYAGALAWQWYNYPNSAEGVISWPRILESTEIMQDRYPEAVIVDRGLQIVQFEAEPPGVEIGASSELRWFVSSATAVTLNGEPVDPVGTRTVMPTETTTYQLVAIDAAAQDTLTEELTVVVLAPNEVNRARMGEAIASSIERCCGDPLTPDLAFDGNPNTRWSSAWEESESDSDPDDEWLIVDLQSAYDIERMVLHWEAAYGSAYTLDASLDGYSWVTLYEEQAGDGGLDEVLLDTPFSARYVRMQGRARGTQYGYSLWEFEVYGLLSALQPPVVTLTEPFDGALVLVGEAITLEAEATDSDGEVVQVAYFVNDELLDTVTQSPFTVTWSQQPAGTYTISAQATDNDGLVVNAQPLTLFIVESGEYTRLEAESATSEGEATTRINNAASGRRFVDVNTGGRLTFEAEAAERGQHLLVVRYLLLGTAPTAHYTLSVNGGAAERIFFGGQASRWQRRGVLVDLQAGTNTLVLEQSSGHLGIDFIELGQEVRNVANESGLEIPDVFRLSQNYPNPFNPVTRITYDLPTPEHLQLDVFDMTGRHVATLVEGRQTEGTHTVLFDARNLASGVYLYRIQAGAFSGSRRMLLLK